MCLKYTEKKMRPGQISSKETLQSALLQGTPPKSMELFTIKAY